MSIKNMSKKTQKITVKALFLNREGKVLFVKDHKGLWELPGGRIDHGEQPEEALKRELLEELGRSDIQIKGIADAWSFSSQVEDTEYHFIVLIYICTPSEKEIRKDNEYTDYKWVPIEEINDLPMRDGYKQTIKKLFKVK